MSTVEHKRETEVSIISLLRRITEIMDEKGETIRGFASRLNMSRETLRLILVGERPVSPSEIEEIANGLGITVERLKQIDTLKLQQELNVLLNANSRTKPMMLRAYAIATDLDNVALGVTERGFALHNLGRVQYLQKKFDESHANWLRTLELAKQLEIQYDEKHLLHLVTANLMLTYTIRREYSNIEGFLHLVEEFFTENSLQMGMAQYTRMKVNEEKGNLELAKKHAYCSYEHLKQTGSSEQIGHGLINIAHYEYRLGFYETSAKVLSEAIIALQSFDNILILAVKEYAKSLMQLKDYKAVQQLVEEYASLAKEYPDYWGKLQIMYARATDNPAYADAVINDSSVSLNVRYLACKSLMEFYSLKQDFEKAVGYYEKSRIFSNTKSEYLNEGDF